MSEQIHEPVCECGHNVQLHGMNGCYSCNQPTMEKLAKGWCQEFRDTRLAASKQDLQDVRAQLDSAVNASNQWLETARNLEAQLATSEARAEKLQRWYTKTWQADVAAIELWRAEKPGRTLLLPHETPLKVWVLDQLAAIRPAFEKLLEYAKKEELVGSSDLDEHGQLRREALKLAEKVEVKE